MQNNIFIWVSNLYANKKLCSNSKSYYVIELILSPEVGKKRLYKVYMSKQLLSCHPRYAHSKIIKTLHAKISKKYMKYAIKISYALK